MIQLPHAHAQLIEQAIRAAQAAGDLPAFDIPAIEITPPKRADQGDYSSNIALKINKAAQKSPLDVAQIILKHLPSAGFVASVQVAPPGFINFTLAKSFVEQQVNVIIAEGDALFTLDIGKGKRAQVEFVSSNPTGPLTVGRSRGGIVGDAMARVLAAAGYEVQREYYFNNAGNQMVMLGNSLKIRYLEALGKPVTVPTKDDKTFYQGDYLIDYAKDLIADQGESLVNEDWQPFKEYIEKRIFEWIKGSLARIGIHHDVFFNEDSLYKDGSIWKVLEELEERGHIYKAVDREGEAEPVKAKADRKLAERTAPAQWFRTTSFGDMEDRVLIKSNGTPTYTLPDIAYHLNKYERGFDILINVLGADHGTQYKVIQYAMTALGFDPSKIHVIMIQMVRFVKDGKEFKGSTRGGIYETLDELIDEVGADAIRYHLLARNSSAQMSFDLDEVVKQSNDNPVYYIQNAHVRCAGIFREAAARGVTDEGADLSLLTTDELELVRKILEMGDVIETAVDKFEPHRIAFYAQELASVFHPLYDQVRVLHTDVPADVAKARLRLYRAAQIAFKRLLTLMGMTAPELMEKRDRSQTA